MIVKYKKDEIENYLADAANFKGSCEKVIIPENEEELIQTVTECNLIPKKLTVSGNRTGLTGGGIALDGYLLSTEKLNRVINIDKEEKTAIIQPGVLLNDFLNLISDLDLFYPPDPTEKNCFIGSTIATNASGARSFKYGSTRNFVRELKVVLPDANTLILKRGETKAVGNFLTLTGEDGKKYELDLPVIQMPDTKKNTAGYYIQNDMDAIDLFIGSEGTLGIVYEAKLSLLDSPQSMLSGVIFFKSEKQAIDFVSDVRDVSINSRSKQSINEINALSLEFLDEYSLVFLKDDYRNIPVNSEAAVIIEQELYSENEDELFEKWNNLIARNGGNINNNWIALNSKDREKIQEFRHAISWKVNELIAKRNLRKVGTDVAVVDSKFEEFYYWCKELTENSGIKYLIYGHFGDSHIHLNMLPENMNDYEIALRLYKKICKKAVEFMGTISAEHGIGKLKSKYLNLQYSDEILSKMAGIKRILDPNKILGIGNIFTEDYL